MKPCRGTACMPLVAILCVTGCGGGQGSPTGNDADPPAAEPTGAGLADPAVSATGPFVFRLEGRLVFFIVDSDGGRLLATNLPDRITDFQACAGSEPGGLDLAKVPAEPAELGSLVLSKEMNHHIYVLNDFGFECGQLIAAAAEGSGPFSVELDASSLMLHSEGRVTDLETGAAFLLEGRLRREGSEILEQRIELVPAPEEEGG